MIARYCDGGVNGLLPPLCPFLRAAPLCQAACDVVSDLYHGSPVPDMAVRSVVSRIQLHQRLLHRTHHLLALGGEGHPAHSTLPYDRVALVDLVGSVLYLLEDVLV